MYCQLAELKRFGESNVLYSYKYVDYYGNIFTNCVSYASDAKCNIINSNNSALPKDSCFTVDEQNNYYWSVFILFETTL